MPVTCTRPQSIDAPLSGADEEGLTWVDRVTDPRREIAQAEAGVTLRQLAAVLDERDWEVLRLRVEEDLVQREIAERVGCSQMHVSRILRLSVARLEEAAAAECA